MYLTLAKKLLAEGDEDRARDIILAHRRGAGNDPEAHFQWGLLCEEISVFNPACQSYEEALRLSPRNSKYLFQLAHLYADAGRNEKAMRYAEQAVKHDPGHTEARRLLADLLEALGQAGSAGVVRGSEREEKAPLRYFPPSVGQADLDTFLHLFSGREMGYATQALEDVTGGVRWAYQDGPITPQVVEKHILGEITLGGLPLRSDNTVKYAAIHIRPYQRAVFQYLKSPSILIQLEEAAQEQARRLVSACATQGIPAYIADSGQRSRRVWFFFARFFHLLLVKRFLARITEAVPVSDSRLAVESFLATRPVGIGWQEQAVLLPLGVDRRTEKRNLFIDGDGAAFPEQLKFIRKIREIDEPLLRNAFKNPRIRFGGGVSGPEGLKGMQNKCPVLVELINKAQSGRKLSSDEKLILFYTLGLSAKTKPYIHDILDPCPDYNYQKVVRILQQLKPHPISCLKIRSLVPHITASVNCDCVFDLRGGRYPSPFLHIEPQTFLCTAQHRLAGASLREMANNYFLLLAKREEVGRDMERLERVIEEQLAGKGLESVETAYGSLRRVVRDGSPMLLLER
ncbi:MAG: CRISPR-associated primase-polymerase type A1 [Thermodesulfobacteriota bacterium]|nr:CRISPR-associated primase-polymerase type A1 [Thermodesulfobacteriota bacterium]